MPHGQFLCVPLAHKSERQRLGACVSRRLGRDRKGLHHLPEGCRAPCPPCGVAFQCPYCSIGTCELGQSKCYSRVTLSCHLGWCLVASCPHRLQVYDYLFQLGKQQSPPLWSLVIILLENQVTPIQRKYKGFTRTESKATGPSMHTRKDPRFQPHKT